MLDTLGDSRAAAVATAGHVVCTLAEGQYFCGVAALVNSLVRAGFAGEVVVGYRGDAPGWLGSLAHEPVSNTFVVSPDVRLRLLEITKPWHLANCKPGFIQAVLLEHHPAAELVYYFDTDIVIKHGWKTFATWARSGIVMALDAADSNMSPDHVYRRAWQSLAARQGFECRRFVGYVNAGCVGVHRDYVEFVSVWARLMEQLEQDGVDMHKMKNGSVQIEFYRMDQDVLNATIMATQTPMALLGFESMGMFPWVGDVMPHAMWGRKPWARNYIVDALRGHPPGRVHNAYWQFANDPIQAFSKFSLRMKHLQLAIGNFIGLLHVRSLRDL